MLKAIIGAGAVGSCRLRLVAAAQQKHAFSTIGESNTTQHKHLEEDAESTVITPTNTSFTFPPSTAYAHYETALPPTFAQLTYANKYFASSNPNFLFGGKQFRTLPVSHVPEVAFIGRSNIGKSSLLNAVLHRTRTKIANVSSKAGRTREMNAFGVHGARWISGEKRADGSRLPQMWGGRGGLVILDMPGYGKGSNQNWGDEIMKYLIGRQQLRRTFVLISPQHGIKSTDEKLLEALRYHGISHQIVLSKIDQVLFPNRKATPDALKRNLSGLDGIFAKTKEATARIMARNSDLRGVGVSDDILTCSAEIDVPKGSGNKLGIDLLRWEILSAAGLGCDPLGNQENFDFEIQS